jgi:HSP20 family molecular chaperone IbpA
MTVIRYEPWALVSRLQKDIDRLFGAPQTTAADSGAWLPPVDIHEEANQFVLQVDLPGVDPKAVEITSDQGVNIKAKVVNGVLEIVIPKVAQVEPLRITVEAA